MTAPRSKQEEYRYKKYRSGPTKGTCVFCNIEVGDPQLIEQTKNFQVIHNMFPYSMWDGLGVADHFMIIPKKHITTLSKIPAGASAEYLQLLGKYEAKGYSVYARAPSSRAKTVIHQHTHLLLLDNKRKRFVFAIMGPFYRRWSL